MSYAYDAGGRRSRLTWPDGAFVTYDYAPGGQLVAIRENGGAVVASFGYDGAGRKSAAGVAGAASSFGYDALSRLSSLGHDLAGSGADQMLGFGYNAASQIARRTASNDAYNGARGDPKPKLRRFSSTVSRARASLSRTSFSASTPSMQRN